MTMPPLKIAIAAALCVGLGGCADYLNRHDTVTLAAGDAQSWNRVVQTTDPWPPHARNTDIDGDGRRVARVIRSYDTPPTATSAGAATARNATTR